MRASSSADPWNWRKTEVDPWDSPWRKKHEKALQNGRGASSEKDCAFDLPRHHQKTADCAFGDSAHHGKKQRSARGAKRFSETGTSKKHLPLMIVIIIFAALLLITFFEALFSGIAYYGSPAVAIALWAGETLPTLIIIGIVVTWIVAKNIKWKS